MVRSRNNNSRTTRFTSRRGRGGRRWSRRPQMSRNPAIIQTSQRRGVTIPTLREITAYVKPISTYGMTKATDWLSKLLDFGIIVLKLFIIALGDPPSPAPPDKRVYATSYPTGATQTLLLGSDDLIACHAFVEYEQDTHHPYIDYRLARVHRVHCAFNATAKLVERAGRYAVALIEMSEEEVLECRTPDGWRKPDSYSFQQILQIPGALTAPFGVPLRMAWTPRASSFAKRTLSVGTAERGKSPRALGGNPFLKIVFGYEDFASDSGVVSDMYGQSEALISMTIRSRLTLSEPGKRYIRTRPIIGTATSVGVATEDSFGQYLFNVPFESLSVYDKQIILDSQEVLAARVKDI